MVNRRLLLSYMDILGFVVRLINEFIFVGLIYLLVDLRNEESFQIVQGSDQNLDINMILGDIKVNRFDFCDIEGYILEKKGIVIELWSYLKMCYRVNICGFFLGLWEGIFFIDCSVGMIVLRL